MARNYARERIVDDFAPTFPNEEIKCKTCKKKKAGVIGYKNGYCDAYPTGTTGKPNDILFENADCDFYEKEGDL